MLLLFKHMYIFSGLFFYSRPLPIQKSLEESESGVRNTNLTQ